LLNFSIVVISRFIAIHLLIIVINYRARKIIFLNYFFCLFISERYDTLYVGAGLKNPLKRLCIYMSKQGIEVKNIL